MMCKKVIWGACLGCFALWGCVLDEPQKSGESCENIQYVLLDDEHADGAEPLKCVRGECREYADWINNNRCPDQKPYCIQGLLDSPDAAFCASFCPPGTSEAKSNDAVHFCGLSNSTDNCGVRGTRCEAEDPYWVEGRCGTLGNSKEIACRATKCKEGAQPNGSGVCKPLHDCCGLVCAICGTKEVCPGESVIENLSCSSECADDLVECQGVCVPPGHSLCLKAN